MSGTIGKIFKLNLLHETISYNWLFSRWDASSPFFAEFDQRQRKRKTPREDEDDIKSPDLEDKINELLIGEWEG